MFSFKHIEQPHRFDKIEEMICMRLSIVSNGKRDSKLHDSKNCVVPGASQVLSK